VHDVSVELSGPAARSAHRFADALWDYVCKQRESDQFNRAYRFDAHGRTKQDCLASTHLPYQSQRDSGVPVLAIGRLGKGLTERFADHH
jgi:hypothetical protein